MSELLKVVHLIPHLGGGVGRFYQNILNERAKTQHHFVLLEEPIDSRFLPSNQWTKASNYNEIRHILGQHDIVQIDFWNHPALYDCLSQITGWPECRLCMYSHVSGLQPPAYIPPLLPVAVDKMIFSTEAAKASDAALALRGDYVVIPEFGGGGQLTMHPKTFSPIEEILLYVGTADLGKFNVEAIEWFLRIARNRKNIKFMFCTQDDSDHLKSRIPSHLENRFEFHVAVNDVSPFYAKANVFCYPLSRRHYGTGEQVLLESMATGLVPVVLDNPAERFIVEDGVTGIVARDSEEFISGVNLLLDNRNLLLEMGENCKKDISSRKSARTTMGLFENVYSEIMHCSKGNHALPFAGLSPYDLFIIAQGPNGRLFKCLESSPQSPFLKWRLEQMTEYKSKSKGTATHWAEYFDSDIRLSRISDSMCKLLA